MPPMSWEPGKGRSHPYPDDQPKAKPFVNRYAIFVLKDEDEAVRLVGQALIDMYGEKYVVSFDDDGVLQSERIYTTDRGKTKSEEIEWETVTLQNYETETLLAIECFDNEDCLSKDEFILAYHLRKMLLGEGDDEKK